MRRLVLILNFYLVRSKGKFRSVYVSEKVIQELRVYNWKPNLVSRFRF
ncbi:MAG: hypothetical protein MRERC_7c079 [Mycoplasmataceae bacterium RC_NB112A]|nr:MAG: hypothetical protein MRERC_8c077 [Mycoplasmataceae bacterium RC_NB112A]KLL01912.1 MAG: hypothetical protein MRERC_7c079 [Mycoplasmataceae bacterium RC_NB112A]